MIPVRLWLSLALLGCLSATSPVSAADDLSPKAIGNRLTYLDENDPFHPSLKFPRLTTPQWIGEPGVEAAIILAVDDMRDPKKYETFLRPILNRLKQIDGRAPVSILTVTVTPQDPQLQSWLKEGLSFEVHTLTHPCPLLQKGPLQTGTFVDAANNVFGCIDLLSAIPGNRPVAFRMPCCDSMDSLSPRFFAEIFNRPSPGGNFLTIDSSVMNITTPSDPALPRELVLDADGREKFRKYLPAETNATRKVSMKSFTTTIEDYPYPYVIGKLCWEFPCALPSDFEAFNFHGATNAQTIADWKASLDAAVLKQGVMTWVFHPHGWVRNDQMVEFIDYAVQKYGKRVKFLSFREAQERLDKNLLAGQPIRDAKGSDHGVRLVDLNNDGFMDVVIGNEQLRRTRVWQPKTGTWLDTDFPCALAAADNDGRGQDAGARFGITRADANATVFYRSETGQGAWEFDGERWQEAKDFFTGLELDGKPVLTREARRDRGVRMRDILNTGRSGLIVGNESQNAIFSWLPEEHRWKKERMTLPRGAAIVDAEGRDNGLRFVDVNEDGWEDVLQSNEKGYLLNLYIATPRPNLGWERGWTFQQRSGARSDANAIPMITRGGPHPNNGAWFHSHSMWVQNEDTATLPDKVDRRSFVELVTGGEAPAKSPAESLAAFHVRPGFKVELVVSEPLVMDPVAFDWAPDGKLWVVEMADYPLGIDGKGKAGGRVVVLEDTDGDGRYDKRTVFLDGLNFPNGIMVWGKGVLITTAPDIIYAEDTDGDGKADVKKVLYTGFREGNQQHRINGFDYGLDNWIYAANGNSGGTIKSLATGKTLELRGHDLRLLPDTGVMETVEGETQFGRHRDDWGNWFGNSNPTWLWNYFLPERYLVRNPHLAVKTTKKVLANYPEPTRVFIVGHPQQRFNWPDATRQVTSANSATPYRDELFGPEFATSVFASEPANNVVHREVLEADGVTFSSHRPSDEQNIEFLASEDNWFRPTMLRTSPDGTLWIADMYRLVIEHPEYFPEELRHRPDLRAGDDKGRIWRVYPANVTPRPIPRLDKLNTAGLVAAMESPSGWQRDTVQKLLVQRREQGAVEALRKLFTGSTNPKVRLQALCTLDGLGAVTLYDLRMGWRDKHPAVREQALRLSEAHAQEIEFALSTVEGLGEFTRLVDDSDIRVRYQLAFALGAINGRGMLADLAMKDFANPQMQTAIMSSAVPQYGGMLKLVFTGGRVQDAPDGLIEQLLGLATAIGDEDALVGPLSMVVKAKSGKYAAWQLSALVGLVDALDRRNTPLRKWQAGLKGDLKSEVERLDGLFVQARQLANPAAAIADPQSALPAVRLLGRGYSRQDEDIGRLGALLTPQVPTEIQLAALNNLKRINQPGVPETLLAGWRGYGPALRAEVVSALFSRTEWIQALLTAIESGKLAAGELGTVYQQKLVSNQQPAIRERATKLFSTANADRQKVLKEYQSVFDLHGDAVRGAGFFAQNCSTCHKLHGVGNSVGPDLGSMADKSVASLLVAILDPNQAVDPAYVLYSGVTKTGRDVGGIIATETPNSITFRNAGGVEETVLRADLKELRSGGLSLMPEGFEKAMKPQDLADLVMFIQGKE